MFIFLLILGAALMVYGFIRKAEEAREQVLSTGKDDILSFRDQSSQVSPLSMEAVEEVSDLRYRMETLEKTLFEEILKWQMERELLKSEIGKKEEDSKEPTSETAVDEVEEKEQSEKKPMPDHLKQVWELVNEGRSTAGIAKELGISKGEVLLLKNLSKHYKE